MTTSSTVRLVAAKSSNGRPVYEEVHVRHLGEDRYRLLQSPGLVLGLAADDTFAIAPDGTFKIVERGNNVCLQLFSRSHVDDIEPVATPLLQELGGRLDGKASKVLVDTVPVAVGFGKIEAVLRDLGAQFSDYEWFYGNVYDPSDGVTPLNWW